MNKKTILLIILSILATFAGFFWYFSSYIKKKTSSSSTPQTGNIAITNPVVDDDEFLNKVSQLDSELDSIEDRLEDLEYLPIVINSFTNSINIVEKGSIINSIVFNYSLNKTPSSLSIDNGIGAVTSNSFTKNGLNISVNTIFTLSASDEKNTVTKTSTIRFDNRMYYGSSPNTSFTNADILALQNSVLVNSKNRTVTINGNGEYPIIAYEASLGDATFIMNGLVNNGFVKTQQNITNASGYTALFNVYRMINIQNSSNIQIAIT
ncbi:hypothetical protein [Arcicella rosea]|uniref:Uncharacterized protein n=1 Tax=Arcicella rosea TaxID=502909 RepID=A0A841ES40_9BACT|nr:hypothetical protein [Arcicella rosea]MBB6003843.1 hypothetical protein [Arcicella rosea]